MKILHDSYILFRMVESYLRLSMKSTIKEGDKEITYLSRFMGYEGKDDFISVLGKKMNEVVSISEKLYEK